MQMLNRFTQAVLGCLLDEGCLVCQRPTPGHLCRDCDRQLRCCQVSHAPPSNLDRPLFAWGDYGGMLRQAIALIKYHNCPQLARPLGHWLGQAWLDQQASHLNHPNQRLPKVPQPVVVPIPMYADKQRQRGYNQAELLADAFCQVTGLSLARRGLVRERNTSPQFELSGAEREANLEQAFRLGTMKGRSPVLLLDDIYTTGATVRSALQVFQAAAIPVQGVVVLARAGGHPPRNPDPSSLGVGNGAAIGAIARSIDRRRV
ncbi:MAG: ComF family protein [Synechococcales cyanobacterium K44_A2020_017]|nr:ComF family protein [Synechococcales cyanobacterium K32_A2020_035]MBF2095207.1 ComF family protein [Synechococcales cyanobacterium K44_A2020_017]